jgi:hypothetical protein
LAATTLNIISKKMGISHKKMGLKFMDFFNSRNFIGICLGLL